MSRETQLEIRIGPRTRAVGVALGVLVLALALVDFIVLRGEAVGGASVDLDGGAPAVFELSRVGRPHLVRIEAYRRVKGERKGRSVDYRIVGPNGTVVVDESELVQRKTRYVRFTPYVAGAYTIHVSDDGSYRRGGSSHRTASVRVTANDRRLLPSILPF